MSQALDAVMRKGTDAQELSVAVSDARTAFKRASLKEIDSITQLMVTSLSSAVLARHRLGVFVTQVANDPSSSLAMQKVVHSDVAAMSPVGLVAAVFGMSPTMVRRCAAFAAGFSEEKLEKIMSMKNAAGIPLSLNHLTELLSVAAGKQLTYAKRALREGWTSDDLRAHIAQETEEDAVTPTQTSGPGYTAPKDVTSATSRVRQQATSFAKFAEQFLPATLDMLEKAMRDDVLAPATLQKLAESREGFDRIEALIAAAKQRLDAQFPQLRAGVLDVSGREKTSTAA